MNAAIANLPDDLWSHVVPFVELSSLPNLQSLSKRFLKIFSSEAVYHVFAELTYPRASLQYAQRDYNGSWKALLKDGNAKGGVYVIRTLDVGAWKFNNRPDLFPGRPDLFYMNAIRYIVWDKFLQRIIVVVEAFGMTDLRPAYPSCFVSRVRGDTLWQLSRACDSHKSLVDRTSYKLHAFCFSDEAFSSTTGGVDLLFIYNYIPGSGFGQDYEIIDYGSHFAPGSLSQSFSLRKDSCTFEARGSKFVEISDPGSWPIRIPEWCLLLKNQGQWGNSGSELEGQTFDIFQGL